VLSITRHDTKEIIMAIVNKQGAQQDILAPVRAKSLVQVGEVLRAAFFGLMPVVSDEPVWGLPVNFRGGSGVGKSSVFRQFAKGYGIECQILSPALKGEGQFGCVPVPNKDGQRLMYPAPEFIDMLRPVGMVLVDEITSTPVALEPYCLGLLLDRMLGDTYLGARVRTFAACNPPHMAANGRELSLPTNARMGWIEWPTPKAAEFLARPRWGNVTRPIIDEINVEAEEKRVLGLWPKAYSQADGIMSAWVRRFGDSMIGDDPTKTFLYCEPNATEPAVLPAWANPRTIDFATCALASAYCQGLDDDARDLFVQCFMGTTAFASFDTFQRANDIGDPEDYLDGHKELTWDSTRIDLSAARLMACVNFLLNDPKGVDKRNSRADRVAGWLGQIREKDIAVPALQQLVKANLHLSKPMLKILQQFKPALVAAGIKPGEVLL
jgi:hypothetical protein